MKLSQQSNEKKQNKSSQNDRVKNTQKDITRAKKENHIKNKHNKSSDIKSIFKILSIACSHIPPLRIRLLAQDIKRIISKRSA